MKKSFAQIFAKGLHVNAKNLTFDLDTSKLGVKLQRAQMAIDTQVWTDVKQYMPLDTGNLIMQTEMLNNSVEGEVYLYDPSVPYGHYMYEGIVYVDPITFKGAFYSPTYGFWSRPNTKKIPSERLVEYKQPNAVRHWGEVAYNNHKESWVQVAKNAFKQ